MTINNTVLVVDDDPDDRALTLRVLGKQKFCVNCVEFDSGEKALLFLSTCKQLPAIIFMDLKMPGMNGIDTLQHIRADSRLSHLNVVIVTNSTLVEDRASALAAGASDFIEKDVVLSTYAKEIGIRLERWLK